MTTDNTDREELLPCPFCGSPTPQLRDQSDGIYVDCYRKGCRVEVLTDCETVEEAIGVWNSRAAVAAPRGEAATTARHRDEAQKIVMATEYALGEQFNIAARHELADRITAALNLASSPAAPSLIAEQEPIDMILFCPRCGTQHIDAPEDETAFRHRVEAFGLVAEPQDSFPSRWTNPPHKSHLCCNCGAVWRPADVPTNGAAQIKTRGERDNTWTNSCAVPATTPSTATAAEARKVAAEAVVEDLDRRALLSDSRADRPIYWSIKEGLVSIVDGVLSKHFPSAVETCPHDVVAGLVCHYCPDTIAAPSAVPVEEQKDGWVTFGRVKVDIENETETFERVKPE